MTYIYLNYVPRLYISVYTHAHDTCSAHTTSPLIGTLSAGRGPLLQSPGESDTYPPQFIDHFTAPPLAPLRSLIRSRLSVNNSHHHHHHRYSHRYYYRWLDNRSATPVSTSSGERLQL